MWAIQSLSQLKSDMNCPKAAINNMSMYVCVPGKLHLKNGQLVPALHQGTKIVTEKSHSGKSQVMTIYLHKNN